MRRWILRLGVFAVFGVGAAIGCATSGSGTPAASGAGGTGGDIAGPGASSAASLNVSSTNAGPGGFGAGSGGGDACAKFTEEAKQAPAALLFVLDMSASMTTNQKWATSQLAIVQAIDKSVFDTMSLGLVTFPSSYVDPPACLCMGIDIQTCKQFLGAPGVSCGVSALPQVALAPAGVDKSNAPTGVRHNIYDYLSQHNPLSNADDGAPIYDALVSGYNALKAYSIDKRILVLVTDGGFSCTSLSSPQRPGYADLNMCNDWEYPDTVNALITSARTDAAKPINTFIVGVPGSNSTGQKQGPYDTAPYSMELALSTYAVSGSPDTVDPACNKSAMFKQGAPNPPAPCHIDLANGAFNPDTLAQAIAAIRGKALGCTYDLPMPPPGQTIDPNQVNVVVTISGVVTKLKKRSNPADTCLADGCWDYDANKKVVLIGKACSDVSAATDAKVDIVVGCQTILK